MLRGCRGKTAFAKDNKMSIAPMTIQEEETAFYFELGSAISEWQYVEVALSDIAASCIHRTNRQRVYSGLSMLEGFRAKLLFVEGVVSFKSKTAAQAERWATLQSRASELSKTRNRLAHNLVLHYGRGQEGRRIAIPPGLFRPKTPTLKKAAPGVAPSDALAIRDILVFRDKVSGLSDELFNFAATMARRKKPFPKPFGPPPNPLTIQQIAARMRATFLPPPQPSRPSPLKNLGLFGSS